MNIKILLFFTLFLTLDLYAQDVISSQGDTYITPSLSVDFTIGEPVINTIGDGTTTLTQGFHQTNWNFLGVEDWESETTILVFPNPMTETLVVKSEKYEGMYFQLIDKSGRLIDENNLLDNETVIPVDGLSAGAYYLKIINKDQLEIKNFHLIKSL